MATTNRPPGRFRRAALKRFPPQSPPSSAIRDKQPLRVTTTNAFASRWLVPRLPRWRKARPNAPLEVIGTDGVLDLHAGDADVAIRYARTLPTDGTTEEFLRDSFWPVCKPELLGSGL